MIHLLIDTTSWRKLISKTEVSKSLVQISTWVKANEIKLLCPDVLREEWEKHREIELTIAQKCVTDAEKNIKLLGFLPSENQLHFGLELLQSQVKIVDELFKLAIPIAPSDFVYRTTILQAKQNKAPFRTKKASNNDSILILSALEYIQEFGLRELFFLSDNHNDFAVLKNGTYQLHSDIHSHYPDISTSYFQTSSALIDFLRKQHALPSLNTDVDSIQLLQSEGISINKNSPLIDQLYEYITKRYEGISFYPISLLLQEFPFTPNTDAWTYYNLFTLYTDNSVLYDLFESLKFSTDGIDSIDPLFSNGIDDPKVKMEKIIRMLNSNLIFYIGNTKQNKLEIRFPDKKTCYCIRCQFNRLNFSTVLNNLNPADEDSESELLKKAYINYQCGNFLRSVEIFEKLSEWAQSKGNPSFFFIIEYNLKKLSIFIENHYWGEYNQQSIVERLKGIDLELLSKKTSTFENQRLIEYIKDGQFYTSATARIYSLCKEVRDNYYSQIEGGFSSNTTIWNLINEFASLDSFLNHNFIIYDAFKEFFDLSEVFTESIIVSHAIPDSQGSKLNHLDDYILKNLAFYGEPMVLEKYIRRYNLNEIKYKPSADEEDSFLTICINFFDSYSLTAQPFKDYLEPQNYFFWTKYNRIFCNILILCKLVNFDNQKMNLLASKLLEFLEIEDSIKENNISYVRAFLWKSHKRISNNLIEKFIDLFLSNKKYLNENSLHLISGLIAKNESKQIVDRHFKIIIDLHFEINNPFSKNPSSITYFFKSANSQQQEKIRTRVAHLLSTKFDYNLYYRSVMYDVIQSTNELFNEFFKNSIPKSNSTSFRNAFINKDEHRFERINMLVNLSFKIKANLKRKMFDQIKEIDPYYSWLLDLNNFDYTKFKVYWIIEYDTKYFNERFRKCTKLRNALASFLKSNKNTIIQEAYFGIYGDSSI